ncbi:MAG: hypothetical protein DRJ98_07495 [Thermoprotei archaeon]|nr:MAG: hypothetical protein DRJ98_07495 [Thermoprotei archaeon]
MSDWKGLVKSFLDGGRGFEVHFEGDEVKVEEVKGFSKIKLKVKDLKKYAGRRSLKKEHKALLWKLVEKLVAAKTPFKVIIGAGEFTVRFDLDHYVRVHSDGCAIVGFNSKNEEPINIICKELEEYGPIKLLSPMR